MKGIRIQSNVTINVSSGLQYKDLTKYDSDIKDRLKVQPLVRFILIRKGQHAYPIEIKDWNTIKALEKDKVLTIGEECDEIEIDFPENKEEGAANVVEEIKSNKGTKKEVKVVESLDDISK